MVTTAANEDHVPQVGDLLRAKAERSRQGYIAAKRSKVRAIEDKTLRKLTEPIEHMKTSIRAAVEHPFRVIKRQFGHLKARYRGLAKNGVQGLTLFALSNLWMSRE